MRGPTIRRARRRPALAPLLIAALALWACAQKQPNSVAAFLDGAERQTEAPEFREEVRLALSDMLRLPAQELAKHRYRDYDGMPGAWTAPELLGHYFVPEQAAVLDSATFYRDVEQPAARQAIQRQLTAVEQALAEDPPAGDPPLDAPPPPGQEP